MIEYIFWISFVVCFFVHIIFMFLFLPPSHSINSQDNSSKRPNSNGCQYDSYGCGFNDWTCQKCCNRDYAIRVLEYKYDIKLEKKDV